MDIAIISATNCRLAERVAKGEFREDLYYRLNGLRLALPPLRERSDLSALIELIFIKELKRQDIHIDPMVLELLQKHPWRGNLRQLSNVLRSALIFMEDNELQLKHLPEDFLEELDKTCTLAPDDVADLATTENMLIRHALELHSGNMAAAARHLGISRATIYRKIKRLELQQ